MNPWTYAKLGLGAVAITFALAASGCRATCGTEGATQECTCPDGRRGAQTCTAGGAWGSCSCTPTPGVDAGGPVSTDAGGGRPDAGGEGDAGGSPLDGSAPDAGSGHDGGVTGGYGRVYVTTRFGDAHTVGAGFQGGDGFSAALCRTAVLAEIGPCRLYGCMAPPSDAGVPPLPVPADAGRISFSVRGTDVAFLLPASDSSYPLQNYDDLLWSFGSLVTVRAAGGDVPAFELLVFEPSTITSTAPDFDLAFIDVLRSEDLPVTWSGTGGAGGAMSTLRLRITPRTTPLSQYVECLLRPADGSSVVDSSLLTPLPSGNYDIELRMRWGLATTIDGWDVGVDGQADVVTSSGRVSRTGLILR